MKPTLICNPMKKSLASAYGVYIQKQERADGYKLFIDYGNLIF